MTGDVRRRTQWGLRAQCWNHSFFPIISISKEFCHHTIHIRMTLAHSRFQNTDGITTVWEAENCPYKPKKLRFFSLLENYVLLLISARNLPVSFTSSRKSWKWAVCPCQVSVSILHFGLLSLSEHCLSAVELPSHQVKKYTMQNKKKKKMRMKELQRKVW